MFVRETEGRGNAQRGLDIAIDDANTGRPRPPSTLSGGETFIAALALALGLSDVVESTRGNVRLDTIFIDEGFGSLDSATLEEVVTILRRLPSEQHRMVGVITHVEGLKGRIAAQLEVVSGAADGSVSWVRHLFG